MKKMKSLLLLSIIGLSLLTFKCDCDNPLGPDDAEIWLTSPEDGATIATQRVSLEWDFFKGDAYYTYGHLYIDTGASIHIYDIDLVESDRIFMIDTLVPSKTYSWYVMMHLANGESGYNYVSRARSFTMADDLLMFGEVHSPIPDSGSLRVSLNPAFSWQVYDPDTVGYSFDLYFGETDNPPLLASALDTLSYHLTSDTLDYITQYYWRVVAYNDQDTVPGPLWEFMTDYPDSSLIFAAFEIDAIQTPTAYHLKEEINARFDSAYTAIAVKPLRADSVKVEDVSLDWNASDQNYSYTEFSVPFIENGQPVDISVYGNSDVPDLDTNIIFPACTLSIVSPESFDNVPISGFEVTWDGSECGGNVWLVLMDGEDSTGVIKETDNDGIDSLTAADLAPLGSQTGSYDLIIYILSEDNLDTPGYMSESYIRTRIINRMLQINITSG